MNALTAHPNVFDMAIHVLVENGYRVRAELDVSRKVDYIAEKGEFRFFAANPIELLGLVGIHLFVKPAEAKPWWWNVPHEERMDRLHADAERDAEPIFRLLADARGPERLRDALVDSKGNREQAAATLGLRREQLITLLADPKFAAIEDELDESE